MDHAPIIGARARITNPALQGLSFLLGSWRTTGSHPQTGDKDLPGRTSFQWHEGGTFLLMRSQVDQPEFPDGIAIIGSDDLAGSFRMTYFDERGTSRFYDLTMGDRSITWQRTDPDLSQTNTITATGTDTLISKGRMSLDGGAWGDDVSQLFRREPSS